VTSREVFVVHRDDGMWEAACCSRECGFGLHLVLESATEEPARQAATAHRRQVKKLAEVPVPGVPVARCPACGQPVKPLEDS
jgi:hypothetical protein